MRSANSADNASDRNSCARSAIILGLMSALGDKDGAREPSKDRHRCAFTVHEKALQAILLVLRKTICKSAVGNPDAAPDRDVNNGLQGSA